MLPVRCFTCRRVLTYDTDLETMKQGTPEYMAKLKSFGHTRICCVRMFLGHDFTLIDKELRFSELYVGKNR